MNPKTSQVLPPKMAQQYRERVRKGEGVRIAPGMYSILMGTSLVTLIQLDPPVGNVCKLSLQEADAWRARYTPKG